MANFAKRFRTDKEKEIKGVWVDAGAGLRLLLRRWNNPSFKAALYKYGKKHRAAIAAGQYDPNSTNLATCRAMSEEILMGWEGLEDIDSKTGEEISIPYSQKKAYLYLKESEDFHDMVVALSSDRIHFVEDGMEEEEVDDLEDIDPEQAMSDAEGNS